MKYSEAMYYCTRGCIVEPIVANREKKTFVPMAARSKNTFENHFYQWLLPSHSIIGDGDSENH